MAEARTFSVFIIDDNEMSRSVLRISVQSDIYKVIGEASDGKAGLERACKLRPDIVFLDVHMPYSDGLEVLVLLKQALPQTMVLMVTASDDIDTVRTALQRGASGFILKPFNTGTVLDNLKRATAQLRAGAASGS